MGTDFIWVMVSFTWNDGYDTDITKAIQSVHVYESREACINSYRWPWHKELKVRMGMDYWETEVDWPDGAYGKYRCHRRKVETGNSL